MWFKKEDVIQTETETAVQLIPTPIKQEVDIDEEYQALAVKLGFEPRFAEYNLESVINYLDSKFPSKDMMKGWVWVPLRWKDRETSHSFNDTTSRSYQKPVPFAVLKTVDEIQTQYPEAKFFISDERNANDEKDPFLMFTLDCGRTIHVVERWDEPAYR
jgi:hypothetical protein